ncbi:nucleotidyltransferase family protein [Virgibacillus sp. NKC19-3]|uniref:nucleotidyltransferase family protein n=1 Tax=Virgibacillus saliphilus TaxID=2831674 RepID=UPI001C9B2ED5|nr:nucleotidyltransferase family protein [Virgibacillus sp. NKC19-3]MBY7144989.1 nucleotidyltransferase family protein [Virgibacillus sp. NKC19-3]
MDKGKIISLIKEDEWMMDILRSAKSLNLLDWWICAGFVRSKIWDTLHHFDERTPIPDIDVIYYDVTNRKESAEKTLEEMLQNLMPNIPWSVKNEARMHINNNVPPYSSSMDAISKFPETATALGVKLDEKDNVILIAPCGISDVVHLEVKPTPFFIEDRQRLKIYEERITKKNWKSTWNNLKVFHAFD